MKSFCDKIPREVRDMVYREVLDKDGMTVISSRALYYLDNYPYNRPSKKLFHSAAFHTAHLLDRVNTSFIEPSIVGPLASGEIIAMFFSTFEHFKTRGTSKLIPLLLKKDFFGVGITPSKAVLSEFKCQIGCGARKAYQDKILLPGVVRHKVEQNVHLGN